MSKKKHQHKAILSDIAKLYRYLNSKTARLASSRFLTYFLLVFFVLQSGWVAFNYTFSPIDEEFHFGIIQVYTDHNWPVIYDQPHSYDTYRDFSGEGSKLFHFLLSYPMRVFELISSDPILHVRILRLINIFFATLGLYLFTRVFSRLKVSRSVNNIMLAIVTTAPVTVWTASAINYENLLILLTALFLYVTVSAVRSVEFSFYDFAKVLMVGALASLVKFTFIPIFLLGTLWLVISKHNTPVDKKFFKPAVEGKHKKWLLTLGVFAALVVTLFMFTQTYGVNTVQYGTPRPDCRATLGLERCLSNGVIQFNEDQLASKHERDPMSIGEYFFNWVSNMFFMSSSITKPPMPVYYTFFVALNILLILLSLVYVRGSRISTELKIITVIALLFLCVVFANNLSLYYEYHAMRALTWRYILIIWPILLVFMLQVIHNSKISKWSPSFILAVVAIFAYTQGGGAMSHLMLLDEGWYWEGGVLKGVGLQLQDLFDPYIAQPQAEWE